MWPERPHQSSSASPSLLWCWVCIWTSVGGLCREWKTITNSGIRGLSEAGPDWAETWLHMKHRRRHFPELQPCLSDTICPKRDKTLLIHTRPPQNHTQIPKPDASWKERWFLHQQTAFSCDTEKVVYLYTEQIFPLQEHLKEPERRRNGRTKITLCSHGKFKHKLITLLLKQLYELY